MVEPILIQCRKKECKHIWLSRQLRLPHVCPRCHNIISEATFYQIANPVDRAIDDGLVFIRLLPVVNPSSITLIPICSDIIKIWEK
jgi:hypothetical protein